MKRHLQLEHGFEVTYTQLAKATSNQMATALFRGLAKDENHHQRELKLLIQEFERTYEFI